MNKLKLLLFILICNSELSSQCFQDNYTTNVGWVQVGTQVSVDPVAFPDRVKWSATANDGTDRRVHRNLGVVLPDDGWVAEFEFTSQGFAASSHYSIFALASGILVPGTGNQDALVVRFTVNALGPGNNDISIWFRDGGGAFTLIAARDNDNSLNNGTTNFYRLSRINTNTLELRWFSDMARTNQVDVITGTIPATINNLAVLHHGNDAGGWGVGYTMTARLDNTVIFCDALPVELLLFSGTMGGRQS